MGKKHVYFNVLDLWDEGEKEKLPSETFRKLRGFTDSDRRHAKEKGNDLDDYFTQGGFPHECLSFREDLHEKFDGFEEKFFYTSLFNVDLNRLRDDTIVFFVTKKRLGKSKLVGVYAKIEKMEGKKKISVEWGEIRDKLKKDIGSFKEDNNMVFNVKASKDYSFILDRWPEIPNYLSQHGRGQLSNSRPSWIDDCKALQLLNLVLCDDKQPKEIKKKVKKIINELLFKKLFSISAFLPQDYLKDLLVSVLAKPFVILAGITGTGKSLVAKEFAKAICAKHILIPVRPDWTDSSGLLGYKNVFTNQWVSTPFLEFILAADKDKDTPYVAILDEMNLARVEYYFSDFLSVLEDKERRTSGMNIEKLAMAVSYSEEDDNDWKKKWLEELKEDKKLYKDDNLSENFNESLRTGTYYVNLEFPERLPSNLIVIGTVNMDETTYAFSPKVLDRANTIEFVSVDLGKFEESPRSSSVTLKKSYEVIIEELCSKGIDWRDKLWEKNKFKKFKKDKNKFTEKLNKLNEILAKRNFHFGYRTYQEIWFYLYWWKQVFGDENLDTALDFQILQKILPKINGSSERVGDLLDELINELLNENDKRESILNKEDAKHMDEDDVEKAIEKMRKIVCELDFPGSKECSKKEENNDSDNGKNENSYVPEYPRSLYKLLRMKERLMKFDTTSFYEY